MSAYGYVIIYRDGHKEIWPELDMAEVAAREFNERGAYMRGALRGAAAHHELLPCRLWRWDGRKRAFVAVKGGAA